MLLLLRLLPALLGRRPTAAHAHGASPALDLLTWNDLPRPVDRALHHGLRSPRVRTARRIFAP